ncbi:MAG: LysM peptidoglycan-binding domain-containing protein [Bacilli bacterium]|nr:LysM peptidoglycan-binding domain-containing protein [Bacilli bacterium]MDD4733350.1 LysM peptidoglycan-binding domain-containing protein [Bacilli bacterium]
MYTIYQVRNGDTLESVAQRFNTTAEFLNTINGFPNDFQLVPGTNVIVPGTRNEIFFKYTIKAGDSLYSIANRYGVSVDNLALLNGLSKEEYIYPNQEIIIPRSDVGIFITKEGDTLGSVSEQLGLTKDDLLNQNASIYLQPEQLIVYKKEES